MNKLLKLLSIRTLKSLILNFLANNQALSLRFKIFNQSISFLTAEGEEILNVKNDQEIIFFAKRFKNILVAENTGCSLYPVDNSFKAINVNNSNLHKNWIKFSWKNKPIKKLSGTSINLIGVHKGSKHYFHIFFDYFYPFLYFLQNSNSQNEPLKILVRADFTKVQKELHDLFCENFKNLEFVYVTKGDFIECEELIYISHNHNGFYDFINHKKIAQTMIFLRNMLLKKYQIIEKPYEDKKLVYISRKKARLRRTINEKSFNLELTKRGFETHKMEGLSLKQQMEIFFNSKLIIATHGAGFTNLIFASEDLIFLEIFSKKYGSLDFWRIANILDLKRFEYRENNEFIWQYFYIHLSKIIPIIDELLAEVNLNIK
jgi:hypothetical protein